MTCGWVSCIIHSVLRWALLKKNQEDLFLRLSEESQVFLNSARLRQRAHPRADGGRGVGAFIFDKVHLQVSHRDAFSCTHPASAGARSEEPIDAANARNCYMCRSRGGRKEGSAHDCFIADGANS